MPETPDVGRHLAILYSPPSEHPVLEALFAVESEIGASVHGRLDHAVAHIRLQWWREECERVAKGSPRHPLTRALVDEFSGTPGDTLAGMGGLVDTAEWDLASATFETRSELEAHCERWSSAMVVPAAAHAASRAANHVAPHGTNHAAAHAVSQAANHAAPHGTSHAAPYGTSHALPQETDHAPEQATNHGGRQAGSPWLPIGAAIYEAQMLANLTPDARAGRLRLPLDELERAGVKPEMLVTTPYSPQLAALVGARCRALRTILLESMGRVEPAARPAVRGLIVWASTTSRHLHQLKTALPRAEQPQRLAALADAWHAWRAARRALAGKLTLSSDLQ